MVSSKHLTSMSVLLFIMPCVSAYIDPGTAGMIVGGSIWPIIVAAAAAIAGFIWKFFNPIKQGVIGLWGRIRGRK